MQANLFFCSIPKDLLFYVRSFLIVDPGSLKKCHDFDNKEGKTSWNNFLCVSRHRDWIRLRKEGLSVCLNRFYSNRYLMEEEFRNKILTMIDDPYLQLSLAVEDFEELSDEMGELLSNCYEIYFKNFTGVSLPVIQHVYNVIISFCLDLKDCRGLRDIQSLEMICCDERIHLKMHADCLETLRTLKITSPVTLSPSIKLPRLIRLGITPDIPFPMDRCPNLEEFSLFQLDPDQPEDENEEENEELVAYDPENDEGIAIMNEDEYDEDDNEAGDENEEEVDGSEDSNPIIMNAQMSILPLPYVHSVSLQLFDAFRASRHLSSFPFRDFSQLKIIRIENPDVDTLLTTAMIEAVRQFQSSFLRELSSLPNLIELEFSHAIDPIPSDLLFAHDGRPSKLRSIDFSFCKFVDRTFYLTENIRSMDFNGSDIDEVIPSNNLNQRYAIASFTNCVNLSPRVAASILKNCTKVILDKLSFLSNISALEKVPYLSFNDCINISSFSCLGKHQKYLSITGNLFLSDRHLARFASIRELHISNCPRITDISMLTNNLYLYADYLDNLQIAKIYGKDYHVLTLQRSRSLREIVVLGKIHILHMDDDPSILISEDSKKRITSIELT